MGEKRTLAKVRSSVYYWPRMRQSVHDYVLSCDICEERKNPPRTKRSRMKQHFSGEPFERIAIDITGPFPKSKKRIFILISGCRLLYKIHGDFSASECRS